MQTRPRYNSWIEMPYAPSQEGVLGYVDELLDAGVPPGVLMIDDRRSARTATSSVSSGSVTCWLPVQTGK
jgi:hypothetical protein